MKVIDINKSKLLKAKSIDELIEILHPSDVMDEMFDIVVEAAGVKASVEQAFQIVKPRGELVLLGLTRQETSFPVMRIVRGDITTYGSIIYTKDDFADVIKILKDSMINLDPVISKRYPFNEYEDEVGFVNLSYSKRAVEVYHSARLEVLQGECHGFSKPAQVKAAQRACQYVKEHS